MIKKTELTKVEKSTVRRTFKYEEMRDELFRVMAIEAGMDPEMFRFDGHGKAGEAGVTLKFNIIQRTEGSPSYSVDKWDVHLLAEIDHLVERGISAEFKAE